MNHLPYLTRCTELAEEAVAAGDRPFGSVLVDRNGTILREERNRASTCDPTRHPEFDLARWAGANMTPEDRRHATVYTSGEHCPMCATAHALAGLGPIVYATSTAQLRDWLQELDSTPSPFVSRPIGEVAPEIETIGPFQEFAARIRDLHIRARSAVS